MATASVTPRGLPRRVGTRRRTALVVVVLGAFVFTQCTDGTTGSNGLRGSRIEVLAVWSGVEQASFSHVIEAFERATGASVTYTPAGHAIPDVLGARLAAGQPPDVAFLPQPALLQQYARSRVVVPLDQATTKVVEENYAPVWSRLATAGGRMYGVWYKAANKSLVWYNIGVFERAGVVPPADLDHLVGIEEQLAELGIPAFSVSGSDAWTIVDWFANLYMQLAGPERYDLLASHRIGWTDASVKDTLRLMGRVLAPRYVAGGEAAVRSMSYTSSVTQTFQKAPAAAMVSEGDFVGGVITGTTDATIGVDADAFSFPTTGTGPPTVVGGGDVAVAMRPSKTAMAFLRFLAGRPAAEIWVRQGGFISPNRNVELSSYPDDTSRSIARALLEAGDGFHFGLGDLQPPAFGGSDTSPLRQSLRQFLLTGDVDGTAARLEAGAQAAYGDSGP